MRRARISVVAPFLGLLVWTGCGAPNGAYRRAPATPAHREAAAVPDRVPDRAPDRAPDAATVRTPVDAAGAGGVHHTVLAGQTLWRISRSYGVPLDRLAAANGIADPTDLPTGTRLWIPDADRPLHIPPAAVAPAGWLWPVSEGALLSRYGDPRGRERLHLGVDIRGRNGEPVLAARAGRVVYADGSMSGYGKTVILDHGDGWTSLYAHNSRLLVEPGQDVDAGQPIARVGRTGNATGDHVHFEIRVDDRPVDPMRYLLQTAEERP